jgi:hypothetical protein
VDSIFPAPDTYTGQQLRAFSCKSGAVNLLWGIVFGILSKIALGWLFGIITAVYPVWGIVTALMGIERPFPVIGKFTLIK